MTQKRNSVSLVIGVSLAIVLLAGWRTASSIAANYNSAVVSPAASLQTMNGTWYLKVNGKKAKVFKLTPSGSNFSGTSTHYAAEDDRKFLLEGRTYKSMGRTVITFGEKEQGDPTGQGSYCAVYAGVFDGAKVIGTLYNVDGGSEEFELSR